MRYLKAKSYDRFSESNWRGHWSIQGLQLHRSKYQSPWPTKEAIVGVGYPLNFFFLSCDGLWTNETRLVACAQLWLVHLFSDITEGPLWVRPTASQQVYKEFAWAGFLSIQRRKLLVGDLLDNYKAWLTDFGILVFGLCFCSLFFLLFFIFIYFLIWYFSFFFLCFSVTFSFFFPPSGNIVFCFYSWLFFLLGFLICFFSKIW
jgi:hypothetical protein